MIFETVWLQSKLLELNFSVYILLKGHCVYQDIGIISNNSSFHEQSKHDQMNFHYILYQSVKVGHMVFQNRIICNSSTLEQLIDVPTDFFESLWRILWRYLRGETYLVKIDELTRFFLKPI